jgi:hypothetical protein
MLAGLLVYACLATRSIAIARDIIAHPALASKSNNR